MKTPNMHPEWREKMATEFISPYMEDLRNFLKIELKSYRIFPPMSEVFNAFLHTSFSEIRVIIIGQDPYHNPQQAHGLCFSVREGVRPPPSLINIYKEIREDILHSDHPEDISDEIKSSVTSRGSGDLTRWSRQGVFLLNSVLTVRQNSPGSHRNQGWERFTDTAISRLNQDRQGLVFLLWGSFAQQKADLVDPNKHLVLKAAHPSPYSADKGFWGCRHFSQTNKYLREQGCQAILW